MGKIIPNKKKFRVEYAETGPKEGKFGADNGKTGSNEEKFR